MAHMNPIERLDAYADIASVKLLYKTQMVFGLYRQLIRPKGSVVYGGDDCFCKQTPLVNDFVSNEV